MPKPRVDPRIRAEFKEVSRNIVMRDRQAKKFGLTQNTIGEIERAMLRAFKLGQETLRDAPMPEGKPDAALDWEEIPPRSRQTLDSMVWQPPGHEIELPIGLRPVNRDGRERWARVYPSGRCDAYPIHPGGVNPLRRLGVLEPSPDDRKILVLSIRGHATRQAYLTQSEARDPTLPPKNLRP